MARQIRHSLGAPGYDAAFSQIGKQVELTSRAASVGVWNWNLETGDFYIDPCVKELVGYADDEIPNQSEAWLDLVHPDDRDRVAEVAQDHVDGRSPEFVAEHRKVHKDGSDRWFLTRGRMITDVDGARRRMIGTDVEITDTKKTQLALEESEQRYRTLVEICPDAVIVHRDGRFIYANPAAVAFYGAADVAEMIGRETLDFIHPDDRPIVLKRRRERQTGGVLSDFQKLRFITPAGSMRIGEGCIGSILWDGELVTLAIVRDISESEQIHRALEESEQRHRSLMELLPDAAIVTDGQDILFANAGAARLHGASSVDELLGRRFIDLVHPDHREEALNRRARIFKEGQPIGASEHQHLRIDNGMPVNVEKAGRRIIWDGKPAILGVFRDLSDRRRMEAALRESEGLLRLVTNNAPALISYIGPDGRYRFVNRKYEEWFGVESEEIVGEVCWDFVSAQLDSDDPGAIRENMRNSLRRTLAGQTTTYDATRVFPDGSRRHIRNTLVPHVGNGGVATGVCAMVQDLTAEKAREEQLRRARDDAEHANESKTRFLAAASHDLRQPLQALNLFTFALSESAVAAEDRDLIQDMRHALGAMESVLNGLIDISKLDAGVVTPEVVEFSLDELFEQLRGSFQVQARERQLDLRFVPSRLSVRTDPDLLARIMENLISNAISYTSSGRVVVGCRRRGGEVDIGVWDTGIGIPQDETSRVFEEFYQLENPARDRAKGLGLGLAIVNRTAKLLNHTIDVRSAPGRGSMFAIRVPIGSARSDDATSIGPQATHGDLAGNRILIIEDDDSVRGATLRLLSRWGAGVAGATSTREALERVAGGEFRPDLIIADYSLPHHETGTQAITSLRGALGYPVSGIIITGETSPDRVREAQSAGFHVLHKPVDVNSLRRLIVSLVRDENAA